MQCKIDGRKGDGRAAARCPLPTIHWPVSTSFFSGILDIVLFCDSPFETVVFDDRSQKGKVDVSDAS
jgi:hypothetical protein